MADVTAIIITKNEERNIGDCLDSIKIFADRILVIDSGSEDKTQEIARSYGAEVYYHEFETHARQRNWAIDNLNISTKWILRLDADERLTPELCDELEQLMKEHVKRTLTPGAIGEVGGFGGLFLPDISGMKEPVLVSG
ncbi:MAG: glycosyltransferase, partial [Clostridia bacterium]|nr:glycosyltransferase [Clostridia bacterium]